MSGESALLIAMARVRHLLLRSFYSALYWKPISDANLFLRLSLSIVPNKFNAPIVRSLSGEQFITINKHGLGEFKLLLRFFKGMEADNDVRLQSRITDKNY